jgi:ABC-type spermidine/putrescine transport system permease subunit II
MAMVIIFAMVSVLLPLCMMVGCGMSTSEMLGSSMLGFSSQCATTMTSTAEAAIAPANLQSLILTLVAALGVVFVLAAPQQSTRLIRVLAEDPPAPPEDPLGARFIV